MDRQVSNIFNLPHPTIEDLCDPGSGIAGIAKQTLLLAKELRLQCPVPDDCEDPDAVDDCWGWMIEGIERLAKAAHPTPEQDDTI